jgi:hypothetical protein
LERIGAELASGMGFPPLLGAKQNYHQFMKDVKLPRELQKEIEGMQEAHQI